MAGRAGHFAFAQWMMRRLKKICVLGLMATRADLDLRGRNLHRILSLVQLVAAHACHVARRVGARCPIVRRVRLVAAQTIDVLLSDSRERLGAEDNHSRGRPAARLHVRAARTVTRLALQATVAEGAARIIRPRVFGAEQARDGGIVMTTEAGVCSLRTVRGLGFGWAVGRERVHGPAQHQSKCAGHASRQKPPHSIRRGGDVVHDLHICNSARTMANATRFRVRRIRARNRPTFCVLRDCG